MSKNIEELSETFYHPQTYDSFEFSGHRLVNCMSHIMSPDFLSSNQVDFNF